MADRRDARRHPKKGDWFYRGPDTPKDPAEGELVEVVSAPSTTPGKTRSIDISFRNPGILTGGHPESLGIRGPFDPASRGSAFRLVTKKRGSAHLAHSSFDSYLSQLTPTEVCLWDCCVNPHPNR